VSSAFERAGERRNHCIARPPFLPPLAPNAAWPHDAPFTCVPPPILAALSPLPQELQYRIIGRSLVLWDHHANLM
jgi:hypothetical protein